MQWQSFDEFGYESYKHILKYIFSSEHRTKETYDKLVTTQSFFESVFRASRSLFQNTASLLVLGDELGQTCTSSNPKVQLNFGKAAKEGVKVDSVASR